MFVAIHNLLLLEIIILLAVAIILGTTIYFFVISRRSLKKTLQQDAKPSRKSVLKQFSLQDDVFAPAEKIPPAKEFRPFQKAPAPQESDPSVSSLKDALLQQKGSLQQLLEKVNELEDSGTDRNSLQAENDALQERIEKLELALHVNENELKKAKQQELVSQQMASRIDEVYKEFDLLQHKITSLERQAARANNLTLELEDLKQSYDQLQKDLMRKQQKLEEVIAENQRLHQALSITEDKLMEANLQRQQLMKRVQFLQDMNNDLQNMSESSSRLQNELRRIGELESMLNLMAEEREQLLKNYKK